MADLSPFLVTTKWPAQHADRLQLYSLPTPNGVKVSIMLEETGLPYEPHRVAFYLYELASEFHAQWTRGKDSPHLRFIIQSNPSLTVARLALVQGVATVLSSGLALLGVGAPEEMR